MIADNNFKTVSLIVPFYNEEEAVYVFYDKITSVLNSISGVSFEVICINDGSSDRTLEKLIEITERDGRFKIIDFSRNFGKEAALTAGIDEAVSDAVIPMDADLQHPPYLIVKLIDKWKEGYEVVLAKRCNRASDSLLKCITSRVFYKIHNILSDVPIPDSVGDYRLMDRCVVDALKRMPERRRFMKGIFAWVGFNSTIIEYREESRSMGTTKFSGWKLWNLALEGITSFSIAPLRCWTYLGSFIAFTAFIYAFYIVLKTMILGIDMPGYASIFTAILFIGGIQLMGIGVLGEYIGRIYTESKQRPIYIVRARYQNKNKV